MGFFNVLPGSVSADNTTQDAKYILIVDEKPAHTTGGTFAAGAWRTRTLNTIRNNDDNIAALNNNRITLPAGTYIIECSAPALYVKFHQARLQNITDNVTVVAGTSEMSTNSTVAVSNRSCINAVVTIDSPKVFEIQHYCSDSLSTDGFGASADTGLSEVYTIFQAWKVK